MGSWDYGEILEKHQRHIQELRLADERIKGRVDSVEGRVDDLTAQIDSFRKEVRDSSAATRTAVDEVRYNQAAASGALHNMEKWLRFGIPAVALLVGILEAVFRFL